MRRSLGCLLELLETLLLTLILFVAIQMFVAQPYQVEQQSMENTLMPNQYVLVDKVTPRFADYQRGDVVVFTPPPGFARDAAGTPFIKRVIGVPGDKVAIRDGHVFVNGVELIEPYVYEGQPTVATGRYEDLTVPADKLFVLGDHREASEDSRTFGPIARSSVIGRAFLRYWPLSDFGPLPGDQAETPTPAASPTLHPSPTRK